MRISFITLFAVGLAFSAATDPADLDTDSLIKSVLEEKKAENENLIGFKEDPELHYNAAQMIKYWGYPVEEHTAETEDGYELSVLRIPHGRNTDKVAPKRPVVFLQHGLDGSAADWTTNLPNQAAAYIYADAGFDVYLGNFRGNKYARANKVMKPTEHAFWQFSWDEMAKYDLPAMINLALNTSQVSQVYYVGFSLGTTTAFAKLSEDQEFAKKIKQFYALAPTAYMSHISGPMKWISPFTGAFESLFKLFGVDEFQPNQWIMDKFAKYFCGAPISDLLCKNILFLIGGPDSKQMNVTRLPIYLENSPSGTSTRTMIHLGQMVRSGKFQAFDYGNKRENQLHYHQDKPHEYDLTKIEIPVALYSGGQDWLADPKDVSALVPKLRHTFDNVYLKEFNDFDFIWGLRAGPEVYWPILRSIRSDFSSSTD